MFICMYCVYLYMYMHMHMYMYMHMYVCIDTCANSSVYVHIYLLKNIGSSSTSMLVEDSV